MMDNFNKIKSDLIMHLRLCGQAESGEIYWYKGTVPLLLKLLQYVLPYLTLNTDEEKPDG